MKHTILIPLDGGAVAEKALPHAVALAQATDRDLRLLLVLPSLATLEGQIWPGRWPGGSVDWDAERALARRYLEGVAAPLRSAGVAVTTALLSGDPAPEIVGLAARDPAIDLLVMATHGRGEVGRWIFGSVAEKVLRSSAIPLLLIRPGAPPPGHPAIPYRRILVPLDGSAFAAHALSTAGTLATTFGADLLLVGVTAPIEIRPAGWEGPDPAWLEKIYEDRAREMRGALEATAAQLRAEGLAVQIHCPFGDPAHEILQLAAQEHADLIVMTTHGRSGWQRFWLGSVALRVVQQALVPVWLLRSTEAVPHPAGA